MYTEEAVETVCDELANAIDGAAGQVNVEQTITGVLDGTEIPRDIFLETFANLYKCNPATYAENSIDDASWEMEHPIIELDLEDDLMSLGDEIDIVPVDIDEELY